MTATDDWTYFREHQGRTYRVRLAVQAEIVHLQEHNGLNNARLAPGCFIYAVSRIKRQTFELQTLFLVLEPQGDMDEADCMAAWHAAAGAGARVTQRPQTTQNLNDIP